MNPAEREAFRHMDRANEFEHQADLAQRRIAELESENAKILIKHHAQSQIIDELRTENKKLYDRILDVVTFIETHPNTEILQNKIGFTLEELCEKYADMKEDK